jgi:hypothetical protein
MTDRHTIHLYRQYLETLSNNFFPEIVLFKTAALKQAKTFGETSKEFFSALIVTTLVNDINLLIKKRLLETTSPVIKIKLNSAQVVCLYNLLYNHPIANDKTFFLIVRQDTINKLHQAILTIALHAEVAATKKEIL